MHQRLYEKLIVWQEAHKLCLRVYAITANFPSHEKFGLVSQMRRSGYSVPTNIAEGNSRRTPRDKQNFLTIATSSLEELHYQSILTRDLGYISQIEFDELNDRSKRVGYLLHNLYLSLNQKLLPSKIFSYS
ncbi:MAG: four helix bundle protein [Candidatus Peribacteraceae bacterium]|nr:four helix bundle protein [Candidatus Peribacteraceae bacterium]